MKSVKFVWLGLILFFSSQIFAQDILYGSRTPSLFDDKSLPVIEENSSSLFFDNFNGDNSVAGLQARGYTVLNVDGGGITDPWFQPTGAQFPAYEGPIAGYVAANFNGANGFLIDQWLISPQITVNAGDTLSFWHRSIINTPFDDSIYVRLSTTAGITPGDFDITWGRYLVSKTGWARWTGVMPISGTVRFAIQYYLTDGGVIGNYSDFFGIDLLEVIPAEAPTTARVQVIHNSADVLANSVDVYVNGALAIPDFGFREATPFIDFPAGVTLNIGVAPSNSTSVNDTLKNFPVVLAGGERYVLFANGVLTGGYAPNPDSRNTDFTLFVKPMAREVGTGTGVDLFVLHGSTDAPTIDIKVRELSSATIVENAAYGDITPYLTAPVQDITLDLYLSDGVNYVASFTAPLPGLVGGVAAVFASGFLDPTANQNGAAFGLFAALPNGTVVQLPPSTACSPDAYEPNDSTATAYNISYGDSIFSEICPTNDNDIFSFTAQQGDFVRVYQLVSSIPRATIYIFDQNMNVVFNNLYFDDMRFFAQSTGTYYIWVTRGIFQQFATQYNFGLELLSPNPDIISVTDVPDDQGLQLRVAWKASYYDPPTGNNNPTDFYALWRQVDSAGDLAIINMSSLSISDFSNLEFVNNSVFELDNILWDFVAQIPAVSDRPFVDYSYVATTLYDNQQTTFMISAVPKPGYQIPTLWGAPKSGISMDNMMPEFLSFGIVPGQNEVTLNWNVDRIIHNDLMGFKIYRHNNSGFDPAETNLITTLINQHSSFTDNSVQAGQNYFYMIEAVDDAGNSGWTTELSTSITSIKNEAALPTVFALEQNYPNPFNPSTMISYSIPQSSFVTLKVYDILGNEITTLVNETRSAGKYEVRFDASELSNGVYFYTVNADNFTSTKKMLLMK